MWKINEDIKRILDKLAISLLVGTLVICGLELYAVHVSKKAHVIELGTDDDSHRFTYEVSKVWSESAHGYNFGEQIDLEIENRVKNSMLNWKIELDVIDNSFIDSYWNGEFSLDDDTDVVTVTSVDYNDTVESGEVQPIGMVLYGTIKDCIKSGKITYYEKKRLVEIPIFWLVVIVMFTTIVSSISSVYYTLKAIALKQKQKASLEIINQSFITFANTIDAKDSYTKGHSQRVAHYSRELARRMGYDEDFQQNIFYVGLLHDIGKIGVQDAILKKNTKLTYDEFNEIKEHVSMGGDILKNFTAIPGIEDGARYHHEKYDGTGYMEGLKGEEIPILARIITVADAFDAMSSARCYRPAMDKEHIIEELNRFSGKQFDPNIVPHILDMINEGVAPIELEEGQLEAELVVE